MGTLYVVKRKTRSLPQHYNILLNAPVPCKMNSLRFDFSIILCIEVTQNSKTISIRSRSQWLITVRAFWRYLYSKNDIRWSNKRCSSCSGIVLTAVQSDSAKYGQAPHFLGQHARPDGFGNSSIGWVRARVRERNPLKRVLL